jgi:hypothetical protein
MEQLSALNDRIRTLKQVAASMREGAIHTELIPEIDKVLALPEELKQRSVGELEAIGRQVREYEQTFDGLGYTLLEQLMPTTSVSPVFRVVRAKDRFRQSILRRVGQMVAGPEGPFEIETDLSKRLTRFSLSIGTPPVTKKMRELVSRTLFGRDVEKLADFVEVLPPPEPESAMPVALQHHQHLRLMHQMRDLVDSSMHYCTASEEQDFLRDAAEFVNFEGARLFNRLVITESPRRVIALIERHLFDKVGSEGETPVQVVEGCDPLDGDLIARMQGEPNKVFVARVTRVPHHLLHTATRDPAWLSVIGRLILIDCSARARQSNTTIVYTLFPHVAATLRNIQTSFAGRPANTQLSLRRVLERFPHRMLGGIRAGIDSRLEFLASEGVLDAGIEQIRSEEWTKSNLFDYLSLVKVKRLAEFLETVARDPSGQPPELANQLKERVADSWMRYFYRSLPSETYRAIVVPGGGRGALTLVGEYHRERTLQLVADFRDEHLGTCRERLEKLKTDLSIPQQSTDEIEAAIKQSQLRALSPSQWKVSDRDASFTGHLARTMLYRAANAAERIADRTRGGLEKAAFSNVTGGAAARFKKALGKAGFGALHGRLEDQIGERIGRADRRLRDALVPMQDAIRQAQRSFSDLKGELDPIAVSEIQATLNIIEQGHFYPTLILPEMSWTYGDVFPERDYPDSGTIRVPLNDKHEMDPDALLLRLEQLRYVFREFPEIFELICRSLLLVLNTPNNPTSVVYRRETVLRLLQIASAYNVTILDDNAYYKILTSGQKAREGDACVAQIYESYRAHFSDPVRLITVGATTKGLQGAGDRTGLLYSNDAEVVEFVQRRASEPHLMSLYITLLKLESGLAAKRFTGVVEKMSTDVLDPTGGTEMPWEQLSKHLTELLADVRSESFPVAVFETLLDGYERLLRLKQRGASVRHLSTAISDLVKSLKHLRIERLLRTDVQQRIEQTRLALMRVNADGQEAGAANGQSSSVEYISPQGAFYCCVKLCEPDNERGLQPFLEAISEARGVDFTYAGRGHVRLSLGGEIGGDRESYARLGGVVELFTRLLFRYWRRFEQSGRDESRLAELFCAPGQDALEVALADLWPLMAHPYQNGKKGSEVHLQPAELGSVYRIEERSVTDKVFVNADSVCETVHELLASAAFRVLYRRMLRRVYTQEIRLAELSYEQVENQYGPLACHAAYHDRQLIDDVFVSLLGRMYAAWHSADTVKTLAARVKAGSHKDRTSALQGINHRINELLNELMHAFGVPSAQVNGTSCFEVGYEVLSDIKPYEHLPPYLQRVVEQIDFAGATSALRPASTVTTGAAKRVADYRYGFIRRERGDEEQARAQRNSESPDVRTRATPTLDYFKQRMERFPECGRMSDYVGKAVQVGPFRMLLMMHKSYFHLISDELRLFPQIEAVQMRENLEQLPWDGVLLFGMPAKVMGDSYKTGYVIDRYRDGSPLPTAWVAREDATDYNGFVKKSLLTLHNERVKALGGMPVHGAMLTITFKSGLRKTLVFSADSGTGKSETITAMMEQMTSGGKLATELERIDILAGDMLSLWRGVDDQVYAFGTETGDFMRLTDITEAWKERFGDLLNRGAYSNLDHPKNPRVTIPNICDRVQVLSPTRVNGFFYINNYDPALASAVELVEDPNQVLKHILVRGLRKNKGTSGDQPSLRAGLEDAGQDALVTRFRYSLDELLCWENEEIEGVTRTCLAYRDGVEDVFAARDIVNLAFKGKLARVGDASEAEPISSIDHDVMTNRFWCQVGRRRVVLDREVYDQIYEPLVSTFCGNPFVDPPGMETTLGIFAGTIGEGKVHTGVIRTQLARPGFEFSGPLRAAEDIVDFLREDEEVNARFQRNKNTVRKAMEEAYGGLIRKGTTLPVELEGYNLLLLEAYESTHVEFKDHNDERFTLSTPYYHFDGGKMDREPFRPAIAMPEHLETIADFCQNPTFDLPLSEFEVDLSTYDVLRTCNSIEELTYQVMLVNGVINLGSSEMELRRFPLEVRKARHVAELLVKRGMDGCRCCQ